MVRVLHALSVLSSVNQLREFIDISFVLTNCIAVIFPELYLHGFLVIS